MKWHESIYNSLIILSYVVYISLLTGLTILDPKYTYLVTLGMKWYIALYLIIRFNPLKKLTIKKAQSEQNIIFHSGMYLLLSLLPYQKIHDIINFITSKI